MNSYKNFNLLLVVVLVLVGGFAFVPKVHADVINTASQAGTTTSTQYTAFKGVPVYRLHIANSGSTPDAITSLSPTPSGSVVDTLIRLHFYHDANSNGIVDAGDTDLGVSALFGADDTQQTFNIADVTVPAHGSADILITADGTGLANSNYFILSFPAAVDITTTTPITGGAPGAGSSLTATNTAPSLTIANGAQDPTAKTATASETGVIVKQLSITTAAAGTADSIVSLAITPDGTEDDFTNVSAIKFYIDLGAPGVLVDGVDILLEKTPAKYTTDNEKKVFTFTSPIQIEGGTSVKILYTYDLGPGVVGGRTLTAQLVDLGDAVAGSGIPVTTNNSTVSYTITIADTVATIISAKVTGPNQVEIVFSSQVNWVLSNFTNLNIGGVKTLSFATQSPPSSTVTITFTGSAVGTNATGTIDIAPIADSGSGYTFAGVTDQVLSDGQKPTPISATFYDTNNDGKLDTISVIWSEAPLTSVADGSADWAITSVADFADLTEGTVKCNSGGAAGNECIYNFTTSTVKTSIGDLTLTYTAGTSVTDGINTANSITFTSASTPAFTNGVVVPTADVTFALTTPVENSGTNHLTGGGATSYVNVDVANGTTSVVITGTKTVGQTVVVAGFYALPRDDSYNVVVTGTTTHPIYTVNTVTNGQQETLDPLVTGDNVSLTGGNKTFSLTVSEAGKSDIVYTINVQVASAPYMPTATPTAGTYTSAQTVTLSSDGSTSIMYSTTDDYDPSADFCDTAPKYSGPIPVTSSLTIRAVGCDDAGNKSPLGTFVYTINIPPSNPSTPTATPTAGTYTSAQTVTLSSDGSTSIMYSTTDDYDPSADFCDTAPKYSGPIPVTSSLTIRAVGCDDAGNKSPLGTFVYTINIPSSSHTSSGGYLPGYGPRANIIPIVSVAPVINPTITLSSSNSILGSGKCSQELIITDNMKKGNRNGVYSEYNKGTVKQVAILQAHINRILAGAYKEAAGPIDGIYGKLTKQGVERLQKVINNLHQSDKSLIIDGIIGSYTKEAINNSCGNN